MFIVWRLLFIKACLLSAATLGWLVFLYNHKAQDQKLAIVAVCLLIAGALASVFYWISNKYRWQLRDYDSGTRFFIKGAKRGARTGVVIGLLVAIVCFAFGLTYGYRSQDEIMYLSIAATTAFAASVGITSLGYGCLLGIRRHLRNSYQ